MVANKIRSRNDEEFAVSSAESMKAELLGVIHYDDAAALADRENIAVIDMAPESQIVKDINKVKLKIENIDLRLEQNTPSKTGR
jgi:CO dehydrogenase nickel-insertion accessory protein CooC1